MVQVDIAWAYGVGASFALVAERHLLRARPHEGSRPVSSAWTPSLPSFGAAFRTWPFRQLALFGLIHTALASYLLHDYPGWEVMYVDDGPFGPAAFVGMLSTSPMAMLLGFSVALALLRRGLRYLAFCQLVGGYLLLFFGMGYGWDGTGYQRLMSLDSASLATWSWQHAAVWSESDLAMMFNLNSAVIVPYLLFFATYWLARDTGRSVWRVALGLSALIFGGALGTAAAASLLLIHVPGVLGALCVVAVLVLAFHPRIGVFGRFHRHLFPAASASELEGLSSHTSRTASSGLVPIEQRDLTSASSRTHAFEAAFADFTARHLWGVMRPFFARHLSRRCGRCIVSDQYTDLDASGLCPSCTSDAADGGTQALPVPEEQEVAEQGRSELDTILRSAVGAGRGPYDAIVLLSGGKDSAYLLHRIRSEYPDLRVLSLLVDNGFMSPYALENAARVVAALDVPHVTYRLPPATVHRAFHHVLTHLHQQTGYSIVDTVDGNMTFESGLQLAASMGSPLVICGLGKVQTEAVFGSSSLLLSPEMYRAPLEKQLGVPWEAITGASGRDALYDQERWPEDERPRIVLPFYAWDPDEDRVLEEVSRLGLISKDRTRPLVTNNALIPVIGMAEVARFGYCSWEVEFAQMVREGKSERRYWLHLFEMLEYSTRSGRFINRTVEQTLRRLGLSKAALGIATDEPVSHAADPSVEPA